MLSWLQIFVTHQFFNTFGLTHSHSIFGVLIRKSPCLLYRSLFNFLQQHDENFCELLNSSLLQSTTSTTFNLTRLPIPSFRSAGPRTPNPHHHIANMAPEAEESTDHKHKKIRLTRYESEGQPSKKGMPHLLIHLQRVVWCSRSG